MATIKKSKINKQKKAKTKDIFWFQALNLIKPYIFKVSTPRGSGTGFQISYCKNSKLYGVATAYHVIEHAHQWGEPIEILHFQSKKKIMLKDSERRIIIYPKEDLAFIIFLVTEKELPSVDENMPELIAPGKILKQGVETAWCGFPSIAPLNKLCFFAGHISCVLDDKNSYLVDGVAINGVSGGPAFYRSTTTGDLKICGVISAYMPNRQIEGTLPGLCLVISVDPYHEKVKALKSLDEAEREAEKRQKAALKVISDDKKEKFSKAKIKKSSRKKKIK